MLSNFKFGGVEYAPSMSSRVQSSPNIAYQTGKLLHRCISLLDDSTGKWITKVFHRLPREALETFQNICSWGYQTFPTQHTDVKFREFYLQQDVVKTSVLKEDSVTVSVKLLTKNKLEDIKLPSLNLIPDIESIDTYVDIDSLRIAYLHSDDNGKNNKIGIAKYDLENLTKAPMLHNVSLSDIGRYCDDNHEKYKYEKLQINCNNDSADEEVIISGLGAVLKDEQDTLVGFKVGCRGEEKGEGVKNSFLLKLNDTSIVSVHFYGPEGDNQGLLGGIDKSVTLDGDHENDLDNDDYYYNTIVASHLVKNTQGDYEDSASDYLMFCKSLHQKSGEYSGIYPCCESDYFKDCNNNVDYYTSSYRIESTPDPDDPYCEPDDCYQGITAHNLNSMNGDYAVITYAVQSKVYTYILDNIHTVKMQDIINNNIASNSTMSTNLKNDTVGYDPYRSITGQAFFSLPRTKELPILKVHAAPSRVNNNIVYVCAIDSGSNLYCQMGEILPKILFGDILSAESPSQIHNTAKLQIIGKVSPKFFASNTIESLYDQSLTITTPEVITTTLAPTTEKTTTMSPETTTTTPAPTSKKATTMSPETTTTTPAHTTKKATTTSPETTTTTPAPTTEKTTTTTPKATTKAVPTTKETTRPAITTTLIPTSKKATTTTLKATTEAVPTSKKATTTSTRTTTEIENSTAIIVASSSNHGWIIGTSVAGGIIMCAIMALLYIRWRNSIPYLPQEDIDLDSLSSISTVEGDIESIVGRYYPISVATDNTDIGSIAGRSCSVSVAVDDVDLGSIMGRYYLIGVATDNSDIESVADQVSPSTSIATTEIDVSAIEIVNNMDAVNQYCSSHI